MTPPEQTGAAEPPDATPSDADLLTAHLDGDPAAFGDLVRRHRDRLWAVALRTTGHPEDAEDALQEALVSAYRRAGSFRGEARVSTWLHRIVVNACLDRLRWRKVRAGEPLPDDDESYGDRGSLTTADDAHDPALRAEGEERRRLVLAALATLPAEQRAALVLVDMEGYPVAEAAAMLECAPGTVKSRCSRGRRRLAALLGVLAPDSPDPQGNREPPAPVPPEHPGRAPPARSQP